MPDFSKKIVAALALVCLAACAAGTGSRPEPAEPFCRVGDYHFHSDFETAALHACGQGEEGPALTIAPEYAPINPSPWYAWRVTGPANAQVDITQRYLHGRHRYHPWVSSDGRQWQRLADSRVRPGEDGSVQFSLDLPAGGLFVAAHAPLSNAGMDAWARRLAADHELRSRRIGTSAGGRDLTAYWTDTTGRAGLVVLVGRQHPPEVTGGLAYQDFVQRLFQADSLARRFRARYAIGLMPGMNPDGVARGHWRTNRHGVDLNRDWGPFTQRETRATADWIAQLHGQAPLQLFLDFHSTWSDVFYMPHPDDDPSPAGFSAAWQERLTDRLGENTPSWSGRHNPGLPTAKSWVRKAYGVVALTYEVGDRTPRARIRATADAAAEEMMKLLLEIEDTP